VLKVDKGRDNEKTNEDPISDSDRPGKGHPDYKEEETRNKLNREVAKANAAPALRTFPSKPEPAQQWKVLPPGDRCFTGRTKGTAWLVDGKSMRQTIDTNIEK
jgi:hypothetical protein